jgi:hypothetical protein
MEQPCAGFVAPELACGDGRFTILIAETGARILAVGRYVGSVELYDLNRRLLGLPLARRYSRGGILIEHLTTRTMRREAAPYFSKLRIRPIQPRVPFVEKLSRGLAFPILRLIAALPIVRQFGELLLLIAQRPVRLPVEGEHRSGSRVAKGVGTFVTCTTYTESVLIRGCRGTSGSSFSCSP